MSNAFMCIHQPDPRFGRMAKAAALVLPRSVMPAGDLPASS